MNEEIFNFRPPEALDEALSHASEIKFRILIAQ